VQFIAFKSGKAINLQGKSTWNYCVWQAICFKIVDTKVLSMRSMCIYFLYFVCLPSVRPHYRETSYFANLKLCKLLILEECVILWGEHK